MDANKISKVTKIISGISFLLSLVCFGIFFLVKDKYNDVYKNNVIDDTNKEVLNINNKDNNPIIGTWYLYLDNEKDDKIYFDFKDDGTCIYYVDGAIMNMTYKIEGSSLFMQATGIGRVKENSFAINGRILTINDGTADNYFIR